MIRVVPDRPDNTSERRTINDLRNAYERATRDAASADAEWRTDWFQMVEREFVLRQDHLTLLKHMTFELTEGTDWSSVAASGKRPFGNSDWIEHLHRILGWELVMDDDDWGVSDESTERAQRIMAELPLALNAILKRVTWDKVLYAD